MSRLPGRLLTIARALANAPARRKPTVVKRILISHWLLLGDTLLLAPMLAKLEKQYPDAERIVLARPAVATLFAGKPYGCEVIPYDPRDFETVKKIFAAGPFDLAYVLGDNRYAWLARAAGARWIVGFGGDTPSWKNWMVDEVHDFPATPITWAEMAAELVPGAAPAAFRQADWPGPAAAPVDAPKTAYVVLHVGASSPLKLWPAQHWRALASWFAEQGLTPVWSAGRGEEKLVAEIDPENIYARHCGDLSLPQLWRLLSNARMLVCPDTGVAHLGRVIGVPTVALFGPGSTVLHGAGKFWAQMPYRTVTQENFPCRDQKILFRREVDWVQRCGRSVAECQYQAACMTGISLSSVQATITALLAQTESNA